MSIPILLITATVAFWFGYVFCKWKIKRGEKKLREESIRLISSSFGLFPRRNEDLEQFRERIQAWLRDPYGPRSIGEPAWIPKNEYPPK
jgi:hypothetical protein